MISVLCPQCKSAYKVDETRIPPQGGVITCKQCQTKIPLRAPVAPEVEAFEELSDANEVLDEVADEDRGDTTLNASQSAEISERAPAALELSMPSLGLAAATARKEAAKSSATADGATAGNASPAAKKSPSAHEVAPGSGLYECPHCQKPFYLQEAKAGGAHAPAAAAQKRAAADGRKTVLVVDDQEFFRTFARDLLGRKYRVVEAHAVADAVALLPECQLLVLDLTLENEDGREILRQKPPGVKCLIFSGQEDNLIDPAVFRELQAMGADDMLFKSIAAGDALKEKVGRLLGEIVDEIPSLD